MTCALAVAGRGRRCRRSPCPRYSSGTRSVACEIRVRVGEVGWHDGLHPKPFWFEKTCMHRKKCHIASSSWHVSGTFCGCRLLYVIYHNALRSCAPLLPPPPPTTHTPSTGRLRLQQARNSGLLRFFHGGEASRNTFGRWGASLEGIGRKFVCVEGERV